MSATEKNTGFDIQSDSRNRWQAVVAPGLTIGIKVLDESDTRRVRFGVRAYAVVDVQTPFGVLRCRDICVKWGNRDQVFYTQWRRFWTGKFRGVDGRGEPRKELLDVCGPLDGATRKHFDDNIVAIFNQVVTEAAAGTLGRAPGGDQLLELRARLRVAEAAEEDAASDTLVTLEANEMEATNANAQNSEPEAPNSPEPNDPATEPQAAPSQHELADAAIGAGCERLRQALQSQSPEA